MEGLFVHRFAIESPQDFLLSKDKRYSGDNRLITPKSSHRRGGLAPRCRLCSPLRYRKPNRWLSSHPGAGVVCPASLTSEGPKGCSLHWIDFSGVAHRNVFIQGVRGLRLAAFGTAVRRLKWHASWVQCRRLPSLMRQRRETVVGRADAIARSLSVVGV